MTGGDSVIHMDHIHMKEPNEDTSLDKATRHFCSDSAPIWKSYMERAEHDDQGLVTILSSDLDALLLFVRVIIPS
jgi:hypothetical protein